MDHLQPKARRELMSRIGSRDTKPELVVRSMLHRLGLRFRLHVKKLPGTPDIVLPKHKTVVFVHGCYWHRHRGCKRSFVPHTRSEFWEAKFERNVVRDKSVQRELRKEGWRVLIVWECDTSGARLSKLERRLRSWFGLK